MTDDVVPQGFPPGLPWPVGGQVQRRPAGGCRETGGHVDQVAAQAAPRSTACLTAGEGARGAQQIVRDHRAAQPGAVGPNSPEGMRASGPSIRSAKVVSMMAC